MPWKTRLLAAVVLAAILPMAVHAPDGAAPRPPAPSWLTSSATGLLFTFTFDAGPGRAIADSSGQIALNPVQQGGALKFVGHGTGWAISFPPRCKEIRDNCPRAILESPRLEELNPGRRHLRYGASVLMTADAAKRGHNIVQKGYSTHGSQFKLQVDGLRGRPSCVIAAAGLIHRTFADVSVTDGRWHDIECERRGSTFTVLVDGVGHGQVSLPLTLAISNNAPLRVGGKHIREDNDQFAGVIDNVFVAIG